MKKLAQLTPEQLSEKAFKAYSIQSENVFISDDIYYVDNYVIGSLEDLNNFLEEVYKLQHNIYIIRDREAGNEIEKFHTLESAEIALKFYEDIDKREGIYVEDFYEIIRKEI